MALLSWVTLVGHKNAVSAPLHLVPKANRQNQPRQRCSYTPSELYSFLPEWEQGRVDKQRRAASSTRDAKRQKQTKQVHNRTTRPSNNQTGEEKAALITVD